jgi:hypothetical protein
MIGIARILFGTVLWWPGFHGNEAVAYDEPIIHCPTRLESLHEFAGTLNLQSRAAQVLLFH